MLHIIYKLNKKSDFQYFFSADSNRNRKQKQKTKRMLSRNSRDLREALSFSTSSHNNPVTLSSLRSSRHRHTITYNTNNTTTSKQSGQRKNIEQRNQREETQNRWQNHQH